jgi:D-beta-D-heptose 7-phosphate kinase/D-beta-D-heptose 1-phosphate adenosyltransferase
MHKFRDWRRVLDGFCSRRMLALGDLILDRYWWGDASRLSPEAPVPVVRRRRSTARPGGAANTAANLAALGARVELVGVVGDDSEAAELRAALSDAGVAADGIVALPDRPTTSKTRVVAMHQQVVRVDDEETSAVDGPVSGAVARAVGERIGSVDAVVISDYAKGLLTPELACQTIAAARLAGKPVFVDPKGADSARYRGATLVKPNRHELSLLTGMPVADHFQTEAAGVRLAEALPGTLVLVTEGPEGMTLFGRAAPVRVRPAARQVYDVTGAGDTVLAALAMSVASGADFEQAMEIASEAAALAVGVFGTAAIGIDELRLALEARG